MSWFPEHLIIMCINSANVTPVWESLGRCVLALLWNLFSLSFPLVVAQLSWELVSVSVCLLKLCVWTGLFISLRINKAFIWMIWTDILGSSVIINGNEIKWFLGKMFLLLSFSFVSSHFTSRGISFGCNELCLRVVCLFELSEHLTLPLHFLFFRTWCFINKVREGPVQIII